jgi:hypothetical protein
MTVLTMALAIFLMPSAAGQDVAVEKSMANKNCGVLHAGIRAELVRPDPPDTEQYFIRSPSGFWKSAMLYCASADPRQARTKWSASGGALV